MSALSMDMTPGELNDLWFGDSGWGCCWTSLCDLLSDRCEDDEVMTTNGIGTVCCVPDIGQCPESLRPGDADAGVE